MVSQDTIRKVLRTINDPEMPINIVDLGIVEQVQIVPETPADEDPRLRVAIDLLPTFVGCPALDMIEEEVRSRVGAIPGVTRVSVHRRFDPPWTVDRISPAGRESLQRIGITVPRAGDPVEPACPFCGSQLVHRESSFGPTRCRMIYYCDSCRNPFEHMKRVPLTVLG
jgi:ring-1,2-phenylacetyl-CoA epoxidase subunit PaaD